ncbi:MAG: 4Fe-4S binding protein [Treponema sp.]|jgi:polyferredoxin|nr:4Fe-4S binding protein [Treponema sp.]
MAKLTGKNIAKYARWIVLALILGGTMLIHYLHINNSRVMLPSVHALCPLGGLENLWSWIAGNANLQKIFSGTMTLFFFTLVFAFLFGRAFCGNICPFGALQEFTGKIAKRKFTVPVKADAVLRFLKYAVLVFVTVMAWVTASIWISPYDPYAAFAHIWAGKGLFSETGTGFVILVIVLAVSIFIDRFFCKYLCPAGALYGIIAKISPAKIRRNACTSCNCSACEQCSKICPMNVDVSKTDAVKSAECIACGQCITACPSQKNCIRMTVFGKTIKPLIFVIATVTIFFGSLFVFDRAGMLKLTVPSIESVRESGEPLKASELRGMMTIETGAEYMGMELSDFYVFMEIPETVPMDTPLRNVGSYVPGWDFHVIRDTR